VWPLDHQYDETWLDEMAKFHGRKFTALHWERRGPRLLALVLSPFILDEQKGRGCGEGVSELVTMKLSDKERHWSRHLSRRYWLH
jgi:hypothetical protein